MSIHYQSIIARFRNQKVIVVGDLMLDVYLAGTSTRICREAPVPVVNIHHRENMPGGAANTAANLAAMGANVSLLSVIGKDHTAQVLLKLLRHQGVDTSGVICDPQRPTLSKKRVISNDQLLLRYDYGSFSEPLPQQEKQLIGRLSDWYPKADVILISDYDYGVVTPRIIAALKVLQHKYPRVLVIDSPHLDQFRDVHPTTVKPNYQEAIALLGLSQETKNCRIDQILEHGQGILDITGSSIAAVTVDSEGAVIFEHGRTPYRTYAKAVPDSKAAGAGDTYVSAFTLALSLGCKPLEAAEIASAAASVSVHKNGTAICSADELTAFFGLPQKIIQDRKELADRMKAYREQGRKVVFTNGCFDILHRGHINYLSQAKELGDVLIVGVNDDDSVRRIKGPSRPVNSWEDRMVVLAALDSVDHIVGFGEDTPIELIKAIKPDVYVKGGDYTKATLKEAPIVEQLGGVVEILPYIPDRSTTKLIDDIRATTPV